MGKIDHNSLGEKKLSKPVSNSAKAAVTTIRVKTDNKTGEALVDACDFIISSGFCEWVELLAFRQALAKELGRPQLLRCDYCGHCRNEGEKAHSYDFKNEKIEEHSCIIGASCPQCGKDVLKVAQA